MARYMMTERITQAGLQGVIKDLIDREAAMAPLAAAAGVTLESYYFSPDTMEVIAIFSCDDRAGIDAIFLAAAASGAIDPSTFHMRRIITGAELVELARRAQGSAYRAPGA